MEIAIIVFFGSILFGFFLLFLVIKFVIRKRRVRNQNTKQFTQNYRTTSGVSNFYDDNDAETDDNSSCSNTALSTSYQEETTGESVKAGLENTSANNETSSDSSWNYSSVESSSSYSESSSYSSCSSSNDSSSSCSSGSSCSSSSSSD